MSLPPQNLRLFSKEGELDVAEVKITRGMKINEREKNWGGGWLFSSLILERPRRPEGDIMGPHQLMRSCRYRFVT
jgi:hypothetical protein